MIVIDASVVVKVLTLEQHSGVARDRVLREPERTAPDWLHAEIASALSKKVRYAGLPADLARRSFSAVSSVIPDVVPTRPLLERAIAVSIVLRHALYDCVYLALAVELDCSVLTADRKFAEAAGRTAYRDRVELLA